MNQIDQVREFWDARPCNIRHSNKPLGSREYFDEVEYRKLRAEPHILDFTEFSRWHNKSVLEIGCGIGTMAVNFARFGAEYTGIELSEASLDLARKRFAVYGLTGQFYLGNVEELDRFLPAKTYDMIYSWGVLHHTPNPEQAMDHITSYLRPGGTLKIMLYAENSWKNIMIRSGFDQPEAQSGCPIANTYTHDGVRDLLGPAYTIDSINQDHIFPYEIESYRQGEYVLQPWFQAMPGDMFRALEQNLGWHLMITATKKDNA